MILIENNGVSKKDVLEKVTLIKDINILETNRAHIEILFDLSFNELSKRYNFKNFAKNEIL